MEMQGNCRSRMAAPSGRTSFREFGIGLAGLAILGGLLFGVAETHAAGKYDNMELLKGHLPPGILNCRDRAIRILYAQEVAGLWDDFGRVTYRMASEINGYYDDVIVKPESRRLEPAWYLLREQLNYRHGFNTTIPDPQDGVSQIRAFDEGIRYFYTYVRGRGTDGTKLGIENHFIHSLAYAALTEVIHYDTEEDRCAKRVAATCLEYKPSLSTEAAQAAAKEYLDSDWVGKLDVLMRLGRALQQMGNGSIESRDPHDPYNRKLAAAWAAYYLSEHYWNLYEPETALSEQHGGKHLGKWVTDLIGIPLIDAIGYSLTPFKGQPRMSFGISHGVKIRDNVGYTERRYFERQRQASADSDEWFLGIAEELAGIRERMHALRTVNNEVPATREERRRSFRELAPDTFVRVLTVPQGHVGDFRSNDGLFGNVALTFTRDSDSDLVTTFFWPNRVGITYTVRGLLSVDGRGLGEPARGLAFGDTRGRREEHDRNVKSQRFREMRWTNGEQGRLRVQRTFRGYEILVRKRDLSLRSASVHSSLRSPQPPPPAPVRTGGNISPATKIRDVPPVYPPAAAAARLQGVVILEAVIDPSGRVADVKVVRSVPLLDEAAITAVRQWEYTPTLLSGVPVPVVLTVPVIFKLPKRSEAYPP